MDVKRQRLTPEQRQTVLELRRTLSSQAVARETGLPLGTVKSVVNRSGLRRDNPGHQRLFHKGGCLEDAERFCREALPTAAARKPSGASKRFKAQAEYLPHTLSDCLRELRYWQAVGHLQRHGHPAAIPEVQARIHFVCGLLAEIPPRSRAEAMEVFDYWFDGVRGEWGEDRGILANLIR
ncbi:hypothetical protein PP479_02050 [Pseudomonas aeruginosa]|uniref:hypothetical protein n=1 Tax=Pseudomonas aeruginosa TaxID=287 RepID=UPI002B2599D5|nr:hypothetical protein [Pseudomonas aeruginosa]WOX95344.1 hypothetical protein PP479_02050 [Pseudomonas aeruginosa]HCE0322400.1 hypothetical protein [Pseudomonas aeruginosa]HCE3951684.1 hypothetical protein [Pseudomonas aeruginosa]